MCFIIRLKAIKNHDFAISLESKVFEKSQGLSQFFRIKQKQGTS